MAQLQNEMITLQNEKKQVLNELDSLRESQFDVIDRARREVSSNYTLQVANLQQALVEKERQLQNIEKDFMKEKQVNGEEQESHLLELSDRDQKHALALSEHEKMHADMLKERDRRHAERIAEMSSMTPNQSPVTDSDELEAERLKMIKEKLKELHANEKQQIISEHTREKEQLQARFQKQFEDYRVQVETTANAKIKDMYDKFVEAHKAVEAEKNTLQVTVGKLQDEVGQSHSEINRVQQEQSSLEQQYRDVMELHSAEIKLERSNSVNLERKLNDWSEKAAKLEAELARSGSQSSQEADKALKEDSEALSRLSAEFESKVNSLQLLVEEYQTKLRESETRHQQDLLACEDHARDEYAVKLQETEEEHEQQIQELEAKYMEQFDSLKSEHASQVDLLETSVSEFQTEKGSLEVAEEHMMSLREQLNKYRNQEKNFESRLADLSQQHQRDICVHRKQLEAEKSADVEQVREELLYRIADLENVVAAQSEAAGNDDVIQNMQHLHQQELAELGDKMVAKKDTALQELRDGLEAAHQVELNALTQSIADKMALQAAKYKSEIDDAVERTRKLVSAELNARMHGQTQSLQVESNKQVSKLREALSRAENDTMAKSAEQMKSLRLQVADLSSKKTEWTSARRDMLSQMELMQRQKLELEMLLERERTENQQMAEDRDRFQKKLKTLEVDVSISKSAEEQNKQAMERSRLDLEQTQNALAENSGQLRAKLEQLGSEVERLQDERDVQDFEHQQLYDQMGAKNKAVAGFQAENDSLKSSVDLLSKKQQEYLDLCEKLNARLESSGGVNEELVALKEQVIELAAYKDSFENMKLKVEYLEELVRSKDDSIASVRDDLEQARLEELDSNSEALKSSTREVEALKGEMAKLANTESSLREQLSAMVSQHEQSSKTFKEFERAFKQLQLNLKNAESRCEENILEMDRMNGMIEELNSQLAVSRNREAKHEIEITEKNQSIEQLASKLTIATAVHDENDSAIGKMSRIIEDLQHQISAMDADSADKSQAVHELNETVEDLEAKLTAAVADAENLQQAKSRLELDFLQSQADPNSSSNTDSEFQDLAERFDTLQQEYSALQEENKLLVQDIRSCSVSREALEIKVQEHEAMIEGLRDQLARCPQESTPPSRLLQSETDLSRSPLEATLSRARQSLTEKLQQKAAIEKELGLRRANLERQKAEKQHLEDLLFEKKRFEQELQTQKTQLVSELEILEGRLGHSSSSNTGNSKKGALTSLQATINI